MPFFGSWPEEPSLATFLKLSGSSGLWRMGRRGELGLQRSRSASRLSFGISGEKREQASQSQEVCNPKLWETVLIGGLLDGKRATLLKSHWAASCWKRAPKPTCGEANVGGKDNLSCLGFAGKDFFSLCNSCEYIFVVYFRKRTPGILLNYDRK